MKIFKPLVGTLLLLSIILFEAELHFHEGENFHSIGGNSELHFLSKGELCFQGCENFELPTKNLNTVLIY